MTRETYIPIFASRICLNRISKCHICFLITALVIFFAMQGSPSLGKAHNRHNKSCGRTLQSRILHDPQIAEREFLINELVNLHMESLVAAKHSSPIIFQTLMKDQIDQYRKTHSISEVKALENEVLQRIEVNAIEFYQKINPPLNPTHQNPLTNPSTGQKTQNSVRIFKPRKKSIFNAHHGILSAQAVMKNGPLLANGDEKGHFAIWNAHSGQLVSQMTLPSNPRIEAMDFSPLSQSLAIGTTEGKIEFWDYKNQKFLPSLPLPRDFQNQGTIDILRYSKDGLKLFASSPTLGAFVIFDSRVFPLQSSNPSIILSAEFAEDSHTLITGSINGRVQMWSPYSGTLIKDVYSTAPPMTALTLSHDGKLLAFVTADGTLRVMDAKGDSVLERLKLEFKNINTLQFSDNDELLLITADQGIVQVLKTKDWSLAGEITGLEEHIKTSAFISNEFSVILGESGEEWSLFEEIFFDSKTTH